MYDINNVYLKNNEYVYMRSSSKNKYKNNTLLNYNVNTK